MWLRRVAHRDHPLSHHGIMVEGGDSYGHINERSMAIQGKMPQRFWVYTAGKDDPKAEVREVARQVVVAQAAPHSAAARAELYPGMLIRQVNQ
jgi:hypothetical protein